MKAIGVERTLPAILHSDPPSVWDGLLFMVLAGLFGYFFVDQRPLSCEIAVALAYIVLVTDKLLRSRWQR